MTERDARSDWRHVLGVFWLTSLVEGLGVSQVFALLPSALTTMGVPDEQRLPFVGLFSALIFVVGAPLVPLWGVWADKYSRKAVIARSAVVEAVVFVAAALSREPWQIALSLLLIGLQLGNTGVMLAALRDVAPRQRLGTVIALFGASGPVGFAVGPALAGVLIDGAGWSISGVWALSAAFSLATAVLVTFGSREVRPEVIPSGPVLRLAYGALRGVLTDPLVRRLFIVYGVAFLANQMSRPYIPVVVEAIAGRGQGLASSIAVVAGGAALVGAVISPFAGAAGDRFGFRVVLVAALAATGLALFAIPLAGAIAPLVVLAIVLAAAVATVGSMIFALLATEVPPERRSATLNLVYLPLYAAGVIGPAAGAAVSAVAGIRGPYWLGGAVALCAAGLLFARGATLLGPASVTEGAHGEGPGQAVGNGRSGSPV